ncbi:hypothetical protein AALA80_10815 [Oscillospiraceae bacterium 50-60]
MDKKYVWRLVIALILILLGTEVCMELRYSCREISFVSRDTEKILSRTPEAVITEEDRAMVEAFSQCAAVGNLLDGGENGDLSAADDPELMETADRYFSPESAATVVVSAMFYEAGSSLYVNWQDGDGQRFVLEKMRDGGEWEYFKLYSLNQRTFYENWDNQRAQKSVVRRRWFAWLRD